MKTLTLIRHAHAEPDLNTSDINRALAALGHEEADEQSSRFTLPSNTLLLVSPAQRTVETASHWLKKQPELKHEIVNGLYNAEWDSILEWVEHYSDNDHLAVIAHNPGISQLFHHLTDEWVAFEPCTVAIIAIDNDVDLDERGKCRVLNIQFPSKK